MVLCVSENAALWSSRFCVCSFLFSDAFFVQLHFDWASKRMFQSFHMPVHLMKTIDLTKLTVFFFV